MAKRVGQLSENECHDLWQEIIQSRGGAASCTQKEIGLRGRV